MIISQVSYRTNGPLVGNVMAMSVENAKFVATL